MPFLQGSGQISIANLNSFFPGSGTSMSNFYRGGGRVPTTKTVVTNTREPASGDFWNYNGSQWLVSAQPQFQAPWRLEWGAVAIVWWQYYNATSYTTGNVTYFRGSTYGFDGKSNTTSWSVYRVITSSSTASINTGIPSSGQISLSQFYGAEVP